MDEYIEREAISEGIRKYYYKNPPNSSYEEGFDRGLDRAQRAILDAPAADVAPVRHGHWIMGTGENGLQRGYRKCSRCGEIVKYRYSLYGVHNFCNYCGCRMDGGAD